MPDWAVGVVAVLSAIGGAYGAILMARRKDKSEADKTTIGQWKELIDEERRKRREDVAELREQVRQHGEQLDQDQRLIDWLYDENGECHTTQQLQYAWMQGADGWMGGAARSLKELGREQPRPPRLPEAPKPRPSRDRAEFAVRTSKQGAALIKEADSKVLPPPEA